MKARAKLIEGMAFLGRPGLAMPSSWTAPRNMAAQPGFRPMELLLVGMAGCTAFDVVNILRKGREDVADCQVEVEATRAPEDPKVFTRLHLTLPRQGPQPEPGQGRTGRHLVEREILLRFDHARKDGRGQLRDPCRGRGMTALSGLVAPEALEDLLGSQPDLCLLDIRLPADGGQAAYESGHIPGAIFSDYAGDGWRRRDGQVPGLLPNPEHLSALFAKLGLRPDRPVVLAPLGGTANDFAAAARAYWTLKLAGHEKLAILDGGTKGWVASGRALATGWTAPIPAPPYPLRWQSGLRARPEAVMAAMTARQPLVDARSQSYFEGREKSAESRVAGISRARSPGTTPVYSIR